MLRSDHAKELVDRPNEAAVAAATPFLTLQFESSSTDHQIGFQTLSLHEYRHGIHAEAFGTISLFGNVHLECTISGKSDAARIVQSGIVKVFRCRSEISMDADTIAAAFPSTISFPQKIRDLCDWTNANGYPISGYFELCVHDDETLRSWFGTERAIGDLAQFGAGGDGSLYCIWRCPDGSFPVVHLGSEGDAIYVLAPTSLEFLRLLAIGYDEIGFADLSSPPREEGREDNVNPVFQRWVTDTYNVAVPNTAAEIVELGSTKHSKLEQWIDDRCG